MGVFYLHFKTSRYKTHQIFFVHNLNINHENIKNKFSDRNFSNNFGCQNSNELKSNIPFTEDKNTQNAIIKGNKGDSTKYIIRTSELKFKVKNVLNTTNEIEKTAKKTMDLYLIPICKIQRKI